MNSFLKLVDKNVYFLLSDLNQSSTFTKNILPVYQTQELISV